jgi:hypothetical protein
MTVTEGANDGAPRILRFARGDGDHLDAEITEDGDDNRHPHAPQAVGQESAMSGVIVEADAGARRGVEDDIGAEQDEQGDGGDLNEGKGIFDRAEGPDARSIDRDEGRRKAENPPPAGSVRQPVFHVDGDGGDFRAHREHRARQIGVADQESGERADIELRDQAEGARRRMCDRHFGEAAHQQQGDEAADRIADYHAGAGKADGEGAA